MKDDKELPTFLKSEEVRTCLQVTPRTLYRLIRTGELPAVRVGRQWRFRKEDLEAWLASHQVSGPIGK